MATSAITLLIVIESTKTIETNSLSIIISRNLNILDSILEKISISKLKINYIFNNLILSSGVTIYIRLFSIIVIANKFFKI